MLLQWSRQKAMNDRWDWSVVAVMKRKGNNLRELQERKQELEMDQMGKRGEGVKMASRFLTQVTAFKQPRKEMSGKDHCVVYMLVCCLGNRDGVQL